MRVRDEIAEVYARIAVDHMERYGDNFECEGVVWDVVVGIGVRILRAVQIDDPGLFEVSDE